MDKQKQYEKHISILGFEAEDKITGFSGVITSMSFDLYGCVQAIITCKELDKDNKPINGWYDVTRLTITSTKRVMKIPNFDEGYVAEGKSGCDSKTIPENQ
jgi:hypothetical protein